MKVGRLAQLAVTLSFLTLLMIPHWMELSGREASTASIEKRSLAPLPDSRLIVESFPRYAREFDRFYNESFGLRHSLIRWNNRMRLMLFNESAVRGVRVGREGWFYYADEWVLEDYENMIPFKPEDLEKIRRNVEERAAWLQRRGIKLFILAVPEKSTIYSEYLPPVIRKVGKMSRLDQVVESLAGCPGVTFIDSRQAILDAKPMERLYHRTDSHWNDYGAFIAYSELMKHIDVQFPGIRKRSLNEYKVSVAEGAGGDLAGLLSLSDVIHEERITLLPKFVPSATDRARAYPDPVDLTEYPGREMVVKETHDPTLPKALVFRDSYSWALIPFMAESFQSAVFVWTFDFIPELIENEKPDIVIIECVERYLNSLTKENPPGVKGTIF